MNEQQLRELKEKMVRNVLNKNNAAIRNNAKEQA